MSKYPWFRLFTEVRNDAKLRSLSPAQRWVWLCLLCYAAEQEQRGTISVTEDEILAVEVAEGDLDLLHETLAKLQRLRIVAIQDGQITFIRFADRQYDKPSSRPEAVRDRVARHREGRRNTYKTPSNTHVTPGNAQEEIREEKIREEGAREDAPAPAQFILTKELREWALKEVPGIDIDAETARFLDWNRANGKTYQDQVAAWRNWIRKAPTFQKNGASKDGSAPTPMDISRRNEELARQYEEAILGTRATRPKGVING